MPPLVAPLLAALLALSPAPVTPAPARDGVWPLSPRPAVAAGFDPPASRWGAGHRGVDLAGRPGQSVSTALAGTVSFVGVIAGRGVVAVTHGATRTTYQPVDASVEVGDRLARGAPIGVLRRGGSHCLPATCLHWGLLRGETYLDPLTLVGAGPVRLLPLTGPAAGEATGPGAGSVRLRWLDSPAPAAPVSRQRSGSARTLPV